MLFDLAPHGTRLLLMQIALALGVVSLACTALAFRAGNRVHWTIWTTPLLVLMNLAVLATGFLYPRPGSGWGYIVVASTFLSSIGVVCVVQSLRLRAQSGEVGPPSGHA